MRTRFACALAVLSLIAGGCSSGSEDPLSPTAPPSGTVTLAAPGVEFPKADEQIGWLEQPLVLAVTNAVVTGNPAAPPTYDFEVASDSGFTKIIFSAKAVAQGSGKTTVEVPEQATPMTLFWRARASAGASTSPYTATTAFEIEAQGGHVSPAGYEDANGNPFSEEYAEAILYGVGDEYPHTLGIYGSTEAAEAAAEELLLRVIWHLKLAGFNAAQQRNPSGAISKDKFNIFIRETWRTYDVFSLGVAGVPTRITGFGRVFPEQPIATDGIPD